MTAGTIVCILLIGTLGEDILKESEAWPKSPVDLPQKDLTDADFYLNSMWAEIAHTRSGEVDILANVSLSGISTTSRYRLFFSDTHQQVRFHQLERAGGSLTKYIRRDDGLILYVDSGNANPSTVNKFPVGKEIDIQGAVPFAPRAGGLLRYIDMSNGRDISFFKNEYKLSPKIGRLSYFKVEENSHVDLVWVALLPLKGKPDGIIYQKHLRIGIESGVVPLRTAAITEMNDTHRRLVESVTTTSWNSFATESIPMHVHVPSYIQMEERDGQRLIDMRLDWDALNEELPSDTFAIEGMQLPKGTRIVNSMLDGQPIIESIVGHEPPSFWGDPKLGGIRIIVLLVNVAILSVIAIYGILWIRRRQLGRHLKR